MGVRWYDAALGRWLSADVIVPGMGVRSGCGMATLGCDEQQRLGPLTVGFYNEQFISVVGEENREVLARGFWFQRSEAEQAQSKYQWGPQNPQGLNRFTYVLNNPSHYQDPSGFWPEPPEWLQELKVIWRYPPSWAKNLFTPGGGTRLIHINGRHGPVDFWHINSDLKLLKSLDHYNLEPLFEKLAAVQALAGSAIATLTEAEWISILENMPVIFVPEFLINPEWWLKKQYPELFKDEIA
jgi:hypothetical protein